MSTPRCGVPDINLEQTSNYVLINKTKYKWSKHGLTYNYLSNSSQVPNLAQFKQAIARAFATWRSASKFTFSEVKGGTADIGIGFYRKDHGDGAPFDGPSRPGFRNVLAHATPAQARSVYLHFDAEDNWSFNPTSLFEFDVQSIALHEIGHNLGLGHSAVTTAVMFADYTGERRTLDPDDIAGITELYK
ncbi:hypothetical protein like AT4G16640 [Hibiscus trionum]|uniref:Peptidase metallopeptidase domain-containing protein n=1 Tax=Hibiscus trionum TaxID=183268 RepID=A0A9W7J764_HIBTR|nr:hypothetical protein like AT4G16640 [Hibiscus trionum]